MADADVPGPPDALISRDDGRKYWDSVDADDNGMLGGIPLVQGFSSISKVDLQGSRNFLAKLGIGTKKDLHKVTTALEGGAGIGRVTEGLLLGVAEQVDVIEPMAKFVVALQGKAGVRNIFNIGLEEWLPTEGVQYDLIWIQWCVGYLTDKQLMEYLVRCKDALNPHGGVIVIKENLSTNSFDDFDELDSSVTRGENKFQTLFAQAGLQITRTELQKGFPTKLQTKLLPVRMYALIPKVES